MTDHKQLLDRLNDVHSFPGNYIFKVIGDNTPVFVSQVVQVCLIALGPEASPGISTRESSGGKHVSVTIDAVVVDAEMVLKVYALIGDVEGVRFVL